MNFPEQVTFRLINEKTKKPVNNVAVLLILYAHKKNNYSVEAKISNINGQVVFTKQDCLKSIESSRSFYLMDYSSTLEQCLLRVSVEILKRENIEFVLKRRREGKDIYEKYWNCSEEYLKSLEIADNSKYVSKIYNFSESDLWENKILEIELQPV